MNEGFKHKQVATQVLSLSLFSLSLSLSLHNIKEHYKFVCEGIGWCAGQHVTFPLRL